MTVRSSGLPVPHVIARSQATSPMAVQARKLYPGQLGVPPSPSSLKGAPSVKDVIAFSVGPVSAYQKRVVFVVSSLCVTYRFLRSALLSASCRIVCPWECVPNGLCYSGASSQHSALYRGEFRSRYGFRHDQVVISSIEVRLLHSVLFFFLMRSTGPWHKSSQANLQSKRSGMAGMHPF